MNPHIIRLKCRRGTAGGPPIYNALSLVDNRFVAYIQSDNLHVLDLSQGPDSQPILVLDHCANHAFVTNTLVTYDSNRGFRRFVLEKQQFVESSRFVLPEKPAPWPTNLVLSPSGRYLCVELPPTSDEKDCRVALIDTIRGEILAIHPYSLSARASFSILDGAEVLFLSAPSYMDVLLLDAATGRTLRHFEATKSWDFCHTNYELSADGTRLLAFGCIWAAPYEVRLYDATPWTRGAEAAREGFPLPLLYSQNEDLQHETILPSRFFPADDSTFDVLSLVDISALKNLSSEDVRDLEEGLSAINYAALEAARSIDSERALLQRRVNARSGEVESFRITQTKRVEETHVHQMANHQAMLISDRIQWFDGEQIHEIALFERPQGYYETVVTPDGSVIVSREIVDI